ncbi:hypothetical protein N657DRAFT_608737 [Parathielavia appendiculata]|uniref:SnoaL-like domain-containing protein n=1 Tax=Parathielavia appendiculata TaxID=2587402 RepID=A0AAN6U9E3_9PEZI|nr:hypothetical protein N657DRAFT_608737 [Parathielavia appendiculata]
MASYDIAQYLLDRANIHDTVTKVPLYYDTHNLAGLESEVYAPTIEIDYTSILGGEPRLVSRADWIDEVGGILNKFAASQHVTTGIIIHLPQPGARVARPDKVTVYAQVGGNLVGKSEGGDSTVRLTQNGGLLEADLICDADLEKQGQNPWRISKYKVTKKWDRGDTTVVADLTKN